MQTISSSPYRGAVSRRSRPLHHQAAATTYRVAGSAARGTGKQGLAGQGAPERRYQTRELLGRGGMSEVYRGFDAQLRRPVAIKRLRHDLAMNPVFRARFRREARAAGRLNHPAIVAVYDTGEDPGTSGPSIPFIVMELVEGRSLRDVLRREGKMSPVRALELTASVLDALTCSHDAGIIHRDIKPANVMLTASRGVKVADFGIARAVSESSGTATMAGTVVGTAQYLSPEQARGEAADVRSDIYSVGCMLYELLVGQPPFAGDSMVSIVLQHISVPPTAPSEANPDISADIDAVVLKALAKDPADRYQSAADMKVDIESVLNGHPPAATTLLPASMIESTDVREEHGDSANRGNVKGSAVTPRRTGRLIASLTALLLVVAGASGFALYKSDRPPAAASTTTEVPAVLGLGQTGVESLLRNADLVPRFEFVHAAEGASVGTAIRQSPASGDITTINSTVTVVINVGPVREAVPPGVVARDGDFRPWPGEPSMSSERQANPNAGSENSHRWQAPGSDNSDESQALESDTNAGSDNSDESQALESDTNAGSDNSQQWQAPESDINHESPDSDGGEAEKKLGKDQRGK
jgi:eukaryotic-like serine/threonine-protein kinase